MDPQVPGNLPTNPGNDLSFQVMPKEGGSAVYHEPMPAPRPTPLGNRVPPPPVPPDLSANSMMPSEPEPSGFFRNNLVYIIIGLVVLIVIGALLYFLLGTKKSTPPVTPPAPQSKLTKAWLMQYFGSETCVDQKICGDDADPDNDGLTNLQEFQALPSTNPNNPDTDGDGLADGDEVNIYKTDSALKYTDRRDIVTQNQWTDSFQIKGGYDPLTPGVKFTETRLEQITKDTLTFHLHEPTITSLKTSPSPAPSPAPAPAPSPTPSSVQPKTQNVTIQNMNFSASTVTIKKGDTVVWTNKDTMAHTVVGDNGGPVSPNIAVNGIYSYTFTTAGTFNYHCSIHPAMIGKVIVQ